jgi:hypothetical protein
MNQPISHAIGELSGIACPSKDFDDIYKITKQEALNRLRRVTHLPIVVRSLSLLLDP